MPFNFSVEIDDSKLQQKISELQALLPREMAQLMSELERFAFDAYQSQVPVSKPIIGNILDRFSAMLYVPIFYKLGYG